MAALRLRETARKSGSSAQRWDTGTEAPKGRRLANKSLGRGAWEGEQRGLQPVTPGKAPRTEGEFPGRKASHGDSPVALSTQPHGRAWRGPVGRAVLEAEACATGRCVVQSDPSAGSSKSGEDGRRCQACGHSQHGPLNGAGTAGPPSLRPSLAGGGEVAGPAPPQEDAEWDRSQGNACRGWNELPQGVGQTVEDRFPRRVSGAPTTGRTCGGKCHPCLPSLQ